MNIFVADLLVVILNLFIFNICPLIFIFLILNSSLFFFLNQKSLDQTVQIHWSIILEHLQFLVLLQERWIVWNSVAHIHLWILNSFFIIFWCFYMFFVYYFNIIIVSHFLLYILLYAIFAFFFRNYIADFFIFYLSLFLLLFFVFLLNNQLILCFLFF